MKEKTYKIVIGCCIVLLLCIFYDICLKPLHQDNNIVVNTIEPTSVTSLTEPPVTSEVVEVVEVTEPITEPTTEPTEPLETEEVTEPTEPEFVSFYSYTEEELDLLARLVYSESGGESYDTKLRVASVVMNRVVDPNFPNTIREVIYQKNQFSVTFLKVNGVVMIDRPADAESYQAAKEILDYGSILPSTVQVFYATYCDDSWVTSRVTYEICGNTVFAHIYS